RKAVPRRCVSASAPSFASANLVAGLMPGYAWFAVALVPVGVAQLTFITAANSSLQLRSAPEMRGRVMALFMMLTMGTTTIGAPLVGWLAQAWGARAALVGINLAALLGAALVLLLHRPALRSPGAEEHKDGHREVEVGTT
ncbi:MFS transporter, partial [Streptomyces sp. NPDC127079]|uniref:MFS transporter n=1 Tax=Streptomyces sp. NPDC127079 TaxID=3347132 RepID=UPI00364F6633